MWFSSHLRCVSRWRTAECSPSVLTKSSLLPQTGEKSWANFSNLSIFQGTRSPLTAKDQPRGNFCDRGKHIGSEETVALGRGHRGEKSSDGDNDGGGELRRDGLELLRKGFKSGAFYIVLWNQNGDEELWGDEQEEWYASCSKTE